jgi:hypothetical protein
MPWMLWSPKHRRRPAQPEGGGDLLQRGRVAGGCPAAAEEGDALLQRRVAGGALLQWGRWSVLAGGRLRCVCAATGGTGQVSGVWWALGCFS